MIFKLRNEYIEIIIYICTGIALGWTGMLGYKSKIAKDYLNQLDLEEGKSLYEECKEICHYYDEVIKNRKFGILNLIKKSISNETNIFQIVIAGAGLDALGIEVAAHYPNTKVFEIVKRDYCIN